jgi:hypothetical protein
MACIPCENSVVKDSSQRAMRAGVAVVSDAAGDGLANVAHGGAAAPVVFCQLAKP